MSASPESRLTETSGVDEAKPKHNRPTRRTPFTQSAAGRFMLALVVPLTIFVAWIIVTQAELFGELFVPHPETIWSRLSDQKTELISATLQSLKLVMLGSFIGAVLGVFVGMLFGFSRTVRNMFELTLDTLRPVPLFALIPLFVLWFGIGVTPQVALVALGVFLILSFTTIEGVRNVSRVYVRAAQTCGANRFQIYRTVVFPSILPDIILGVRYGLIAAWGLDVAAEFSGGSTEGLGYFMIVRGQYLDTAGVIVAVIIYCSLAIVFDRILRYVGRKAMPWSPRAAGHDMTGEMLGGRG